MKAGKFGYVYIVPAAEAASIDLRQLDMFDKRIHNGLTWFAVASSMKLPALARQSMYVVALWSGEVLSTRAGANEASWVSLHEDLFADRCDLKYLFGPYKGDVQQCYRSMMERVQLQHQKIRTFGIHMNNVEIYADNKPFESPAVAAVLLRGAEKQISENEALLCELQYRQDMRGCLDELNRLLTSELKRHELDTFSDTMAKRFPNSGT